MSNVGYDAVKEILPEALVMIHLANAYNAADYDCWFFKEFKEAGGKFDIIGLSHYPDYNDWNSEVSGTVSNFNAAKSIKTLGEQLGVPVIIAETGFSNYDADKASAVMKDLFEKTSDLPQCVGIFYWEPEVDGQWKPSYYDTVGWGAYGMGAFTTDGKPTAALDAFSGDSSGITTVVDDSENMPVLWYDLQGHEIASPTNGIFIKKQGQNSEKVVLP